jgi:hypothetical protein
LIALAALALCALTSADASRAAREGAALAASLRSYSVRPWVLWDRKDPLRAVHGRADLDAVIVETPYEHVRYDGYMQRLQGLPLGAVQIDRFRRDADGRYGFMVYAHSRTDDRAEAGFLKKFSNASVQLANAVTLSAVERAYVGSTPAFYDVGTFREERYTGSLTYRFPAPPSGCAPTGVLRFRDGRGHTYRFSFDLSRKAERYRDTDRVLRETAVPSDALVTAAVEPFARQR